MKAFERIILVCSTCLALVAPAAAQQRGNHATGSVEGQTSVNCDPRWPAPRFGTSFEDVHQAISDHVPRELRELLRQVFSSDRTRSIDAARELKALRAEAMPAIPFMLEVVSYGNVQLALMKRARPWTPGVAACGALWQLREAAQPQLVDALRNSSSDEVRASAAWLLGYLYRPRSGKSTPTLVNEAVTTALLDALEDASPVVVLEAANTLGGLGIGQAAEALIGLLEHECTPVRLAAIRALTALKAMAAARPLLAQLNDADKEVRVLVAYAFTRIPAPWAAPELLPLLEDEHRAVCSSALRALGHLANPATTPVLIEKLRDPQRQDRHRLAGVLGEIGDARATLPLVDCLQSANSELRHAAARSLGLIRDRRAVPYLIDLLQDDTPALRIAAAESLSQMGDRRAVEVLIAALGDPQERVIAAVASALGRLNDPRAIQPLIDILFDEKERSYSFYEQVAESLRKIRHPDVIYRLIDSLQDKPNYARLTALRTLNRLTGLNRSDHDPRTPDGWRAWKAQQTRQE